MAIDKTIGFIGAGNMAEAMIRGLLRGKVFAPEDVVASAPREERRAELAEKYGIRAVEDNREAASQAIVVLSVKPQILSRVLEEVSAAVRPGALVISIAAGVPVAAIESRLAPGHYSAVGNKAVAEVLAEVIANRGPRPEARGLEDGNR